MLKVDLILMPMLMISGCRGDLTDGSLWSAV